MCYTVCVDNVDSGSRLIWAAADTDKVKNL